MLCALRSEQGVCLVRAKLITGETQQDLRECAAKQGLEKILTYLLTYLLTYTSEKRTVGRN